MFVRATVCCGIVGLCAEYLTNCVPRPAAPTTSALHVSVWHVTFCSVVAP